MDSHKPIYVTRSGRRARQLHILYQNRPNRRYHDADTMSHGEQQQQQQQHNDALRQRQEIANEPERLRLLREELENLRNNLHAEQQAVQRQREELAQRNNQLQNNAPRAHRPEPILAVADVGNIVNQLSNIQIDIKLPKFDNETLKNPIEFLNEFDKFCQIKRIDDGNRTLLIQQCLEGKARTWCELRGVFENYQVFR